MKYNHLPPERNKASLIVEKIFCPEGRSRGTSFAVSFFREIFARLAGETLNNYFCVS
jgi:hypothetical protein